MRTFTYLLFLSLSCNLLAQKMGKQTLAQLKGSPTGARIIWFLDAVESGEVSNEEINNQFSQAIINKIGVEGLLNTFGDINENDGTLVLYTAKRSKKDEYKLLLKGTKSEEWLEMKFYFEDSEPFKLRGFSIDAIENGNELLDPIYPKSN